MAIYGRDRANCSLEDPFSPFVSLPLLSCKSCCIVIVFPNGKINLGLRDKQKRSDGYHEIESIFYPIQLRDVLEILPAMPGPQTSGNRNDGSNETTLHNFGMPVAGAVSDNLCLIAYQLLKKDYPDLPAVDIYLLKNIPMGSGLGGGSADGALTLQLLNKKFRMQLSTSQLTDYALKLGSDCPFFIINQPCFATGRGEIMEPLDLNLADYQLVLVQPGVHINTAWAFSQLELPGTAPSGSNKKEIMKTIRGPVEKWKEELINDFEAPVFVRYPELNRLKESLYESGALFASMSGSGSSIFGLFDKNRPLSLNISVPFQVLNF